MYVYVYVILSFKNQNLKTVVIKFKKLKKFNYTRMLRKSYLHI